MKKGVRFIDGVEHLLAGKLDTREEAEREASAMRHHWERVVVRKSRFDYTVWVHGWKGTR